jgi:1-acyl-sn-glycerol-3-phosphate acyltransferase
VEYVASAGELGAGARSARASWPVAIARTLRTGGEALNCARELRRDPGRRNPKLRAARLVGACARVGECMRLHVEVRGAVPDEPCVVVANHLSYLDPIAIGQTHPLGAVAKLEILGWPGIGEVLDDLGIIFVKRECARSGAVALRKTMRLLDAGVSVLVFPEGTTSMGRDVLPFSRGAFGVARMMHVPVVPATLRYESTDACWVGDDSLLPHVLRLHRFNQVNAELVFGPSLQPMAFSSPSALADTARQCIRNLLLP